MSLRPLAWFPKRFTAGDMDGTGGDRLLGRTELSPLEVLIRETAQNSWDARAPRQVPRYGVDLRRVDFRLRADLDHLFSAGRVPGLHHVPSVRNLHVLEIFDRGTTGLDGPVDLSPTAKDEAKNFQDLILKVGVPRDDGQGGGTYGFGKTAAYAFSEQGTVIFWTRCRNPQGQLEHRFIISAFHESYVSEGVQYTGRHWWGTGSGDLVQPLVGVEAQRYGERFFARHFDADETGTSLLILDPRLPLPGTLGLDEPAPEDLRYGDPAKVEAEFVRQSRRAIRRHLWPKLIPAPWDDSCPMPISLKAHSAEVALIDEAPGAIDFWGAGLNAIRAHLHPGASAVESPSGIPVVVHDVHRYRDTIGYLAVVRRMPGVEQRHPDDDLDPAGGDDAPLRIALMRNQAELVVTTEDWSDFAPPPGFDWLAVFKSAKEWDRTYADAEPPAHDMWVSSAGGDAGLVIRHTRNKVRSLLRETFAVPEPEDAAEEERARLGVGTLARRLGVLLPVARADVPGAPNGASGGGAGGRRAARRQLVSIDAPYLVETLRDGRQRQRVEFEVKADGEALVRIEVFVIGDEGARELLSESQVEATWSDGRAVSGTEARVAGGVPQSVTISGPPRRALRIEMNARAIDAGD
ncbi:hypothetical protein E4U02_14460 [Microbacterium paludicola]|uniref:Uncharacterized protein n=1 Tax=Microbacterium paludicola TaxID=300019 RepID=A0A4Y9FMZ1_9MICO|nr:hypothetical protein [Microbacterium paludicola]MBF0817606.1 hypothetical protein [Microbacterium paludicola]TFU30584.1 hypothetical protein E4U02_14460 [Microbacterium paludicola]